MYFDRGIAFHGVRKPVRTRPQSHRCVRTWPRQQDWLFKRLKIRDRVFVYGDYWRGRSAPLVATAVEPEPLRAPRTSLAQARRITQ